MTFKYTILDFYYKAIYKINSWNWIMIWLTIISIELSLLFSCAIEPKSNDFSNNSLVLILTINGLFSAILVTYFFNRISWILENKKETYNEAVLFSQKITEFRRILKTLTQYYQVWKDDNSTKSLLEHGEYKYIDYIDFKMYYISDGSYVSSDKKLIEKLRKDERYQKGISDLFFGMISLVYNRKDKYRGYDSILYKDFQKKGIYNLNFIKRVNEAEYASRLWYWLDKDYDYINYNALSANSKDYIMKSFERINIKYKERELNNQLMAEICEDMNEHYFKELYELLQKLNKGLSGINLLIFIILIASLVFGVLIPFLLYFIDFNLKNTLTKLMIGINFGLLFFFITNLFGIIKKEITWT